MIILTRYHGPPIGSPVGLGRGSHTSMHHTKIIHSTCWLFQAFWTIHSNNRWLVWPLYNYIGLEPITWITLGSKTVILVASRENARPMPAIVQITCYLPHILIYFRHTISAWIDILLSCPLGLGCDGIAVMVKQFFHFAILKKHCVTNMWFVVDWEGSHLLSTGLPMILKIVILII